MPQQNFNNTPVWLNILLDEPRQTRVERFVQPITLPVMQKSANCLVLIAHGSRDPRWREPFDRLHATVRRTSSKPVKLAFMEFISPTLMDCAEQAEHEGVTELNILPVFMAGGAHVATDIPQQAQQVRERFPHMQVKILTPLGEDRRMFSLMCEIVREKIA